MTHHLRHLPDVLAEVVPDLRNPWLAFGAAICLLVTALTWFGLAQSSPIRAAEEAVKTRLALPSIQIDSRLHYRPELPAYPMADVLVCGRINEGRSYGALVNKLRRGGVLSLIGPGDRVLELAISGSTKLTARQVEVLAACSRRTSS